MILKYEIPLVRNALKEAASELIFMIVTKQHSGRFYPDPIPSGGPIQQNVKSRTVVDKRYVNPYASEFFCSAMSVVW
ncbi:Argonaute protein wago-1 [Aphelenchoides besseyi]|nr:Argonaute protein wago-1 [Aphelenchoides besseyi]